ncbi:MAG: GAF domain-containing sensor histidine kinase [Candidatus Limnocylindria bacterium]
MNEPNVSWEVRARRAEAHLAALDVAVQGISGVLALDSVLQLIVDHVRDLAEAQYAALGIVNEDGAIERFITSGLDAAERERIGALPRGRGLLGLIIGEGQTFRIADIAQDPRRYGFPPNHPEMRSFLGVPINVKGRAVGDLYLTNKRGAPEFSADDQTLVERFASHAGLAIENARLSERVQALAVVEERERIGRDLHDGIIQRIYAVTLGLDDVPEITLQDPAAAAERVERAIDALHAAIGEIRTFIYGLRPGLDAPRGIASALETLAEETRLNTPIQIEVDADAAPALSATVISELLSIAREALSNATRHASATQVVLSVEGDGAELRLEIADDGAGFDGSAAPTPGHHGLSNMRRRAESLGGRLQVESGKGRGTRIIAVVPLPE